MFNSAFCGKIDEIPGISVDNFENSGVVNARAYFLSHCHSDHTQGLYSEALIRTLEKTEACLYMSEPSAAIVDHEKTDFRIMKYVRPLKLGTNHIVLPSNPSENLEELLIDVILIPAGHSFGSVMFIFKTPNKTVLFTGDFRMSPNNLSAYAHFHNGSDPIKIDAMYVDTTFIGRRYLFFPKRSESIESLIELIRNHLKNKCNQIALHTSARYGYEYVYNEIHEKLDLKVYVGEDRWRFYSKVLHLVPGVTNDPNSTKIHLCRNNTEKKDHTKCMAIIQGDQNVLYIHFSAMKWDNFTGDDNALNRVSENRVDVCFATHCSRSELMYFVKYFSPKKVVGFPEKFPDEEKDLEAIKFPCKKRKILGETQKKNKVDRKVDKELLREMFEV